MISSSNNFEVSLLIPVYNCEMYIERAIRSALSNLKLTPGLEIVVIDDGSSDETSHILEKFKNQITLLKHTLKIKDCPQLLILE